MRRKRLKIALLLALLIANLVQFALMIASDPYIPLAQSDYQLRDSSQAGQALSAEQQKVQVLIKSNLYSPLPVLWMLLLNTTILVAILLLESSSATSHRQPVETSAQSGIR